ncbi:DUF2156 domain-containing protein [Clostridium botulinum]|nr:DUF2156 domain-containing protein [Clostridium botulinum]
MLNFKRLTINDKKLFESYIKPYNFLNCEYSFTTLYIWRKALDIKYAIYKGALIIKKKDFNDAYHFMQPLGYKKENLKDIIEVLINYKKEKSIKCLFKDLRYDFVEELKSLYKDEEIYNNIVVEEDRDNFDYLYESKKLITLSGKKLHGKKNHYNYFIKNYNYSIKDFKEEGVLEDSLKIAQLWYEKNEIKDKHLLYELQSIRDMCYNMEILGLKGMALYIDGEIAGFSIGEKFSDDMAIIHIEKANKDIRGAYTFVNKAFVENYFSDTPIINREQDLGIEGLRKAKLSYSPLDFEKKYVLDLCCNCGCSDREDREKQII